MFELLFAARIREPMKESSHRWSFERRSGLAFPAYEILDIDFQYPAISIEIHVVAQLARRGEMDSTPDAVSATVGIPIRTAC
jgi:hypothetical protein